MLFDDFVGWETQTDHRDHKVSHTSYFKKNFLLKPTKQLISEKSGYKIVKNHLWGSVVFFK